MVSELGSKFSTHNDENSYLKVENEALKGELTESSRGFMDKIRDLEASNESLKTTIGLSSRRLNASFDSDVLKSRQRMENRSTVNFNNSSIMDMSY